MNNDPHSIFDKAKRLSLTASERKALSIAIARIRATTPVRSPFYFHARMFTQVAAFALIVVLAGGGTTIAAASGALPGELLYTVKIQVNEQMELVFTRNLEEQTKVTATQALRRVEEAQTLASRGTLTQETAKIVEENFVKKTGDFDKRVIKLRERGSARVASVETSFDDDLDEHVKEFEKLENSSSSTPPSVTSVKEAVRKQRKDSSDKRREGAKREERISQSDDEQSDDKKDEKKKDDSKNDSGGGDGRDRSSDSNSGSGNDSSDD